jgi:hypothetical protein
MSKISEGARDYVSSEIDMWLDTFPTHFGEQWGGGACEFDFQGLLLTAELHKELARCALAFAAKHGLETSITQKDVDESIDECIEITKENMTDEEEDEEEDDEDEEEDEEEDATAAAAAAAAATVPTTPKKEAKPSAEAPGAPMKAPRPSDK